MKKAVVEDNLYENVNVRVCCQHGKPCRKSKQERLIELGKVSSNALVLRTCVKEENTYENLDPKKIAPETLFLGNGNQIMVNRLPGEQKKTDNESTDTTDSSVSEKKSMTKDLAKKVYLGSVNWRKAERMMVGVVGLYRMAEDPKQPLFLLVKQKSGLKHYRIIQRTFTGLDTGTVFLAEDGTSSPQEFFTLSDLVKYYGDKFLYKKDK